MNRRLLLLGGLLCLLALAGAFIWLAQKLLESEDNSRQLTTQTEKIPEVTPQQRIQDYLQTPEAPLPQPEPEALLKREPLHKTPPLPRIPPDPPGEPSPARPPATERPVLASPAEAMQDVAAFLLSRYEFHDKKGRLNLQFYELVDRYAPRDMPPDIVYSVSPSVMQLAFLFAEKRFVELVRQEAEEQLPVDAAANYLQQLAFWLQGAANCPEALAQDRPRLAAPVDGQDCKRSLARLRAMLDPGNRKEVEATAGKLLQRLAASMESQAIALRGGSATADK